MALIELPVPFDADGLAQGGNWALRTTHRRVDLMHWVPGIGGYEDLADLEDLARLREARGES
jgi:hypothetical protein